MTLTEFFRENPKVALGFSGGVDSAYLLYAALDAHADIRPYYIKTAFQPQFEREDAERLVRQLGIDMTVLEHDVLANDVVAANEPDRCYHCKAALFSLLKKQAARDGYMVIIDGTNASDVADDRPGMRALRELGVRSPLRECGLTKADIRELSNRARLFTWDKPAYACLATRVPAGQPITDELLWRVEQAEAALFKLGFSDFRIRVFHDAARLQFIAEQLAKALAERENILLRLKPWFTVILLDLEVR